MTKLEKILIINNDLDDIVAMKARLPSDIKVLGATQGEARDLAYSGFPEFDLIVIDNDANNRQQSAGKSTLAELRGKKVTTPVVYTSFQTGWVDKKVASSEGVTIVRTDKALDYIAEKFGLTLRDVPKADKPESQLSIILSYNPVSGYQPDTYGNGKLLVASYKKAALSTAKKVLSEKLDEIYKGFDWRKDRDKIKNIFVYDGVNGGDVPGVAASCLGHDIRMQVNLMACPCDWSRKERLRGSRDIALYKVECSGRKTLGAIADVILGIERPGIDYNKLTISKDKILETAPKHEFY